RHPPQPQPTLFPYTTLFRSAEPGDDSEPHTGHEDKAISVPFRLQPHRVERREHREPAYRDGRIETDQRESQDRFAGPGGKRGRRSEEHTSELQSRSDLVCRL